MIFTMHYDISWLVTNSLEFNAKRYMRFLRPPSLLSIDTIKSRHYVSTDYYCINLKNASFSNNYINAVLDETQNGTVGAA